jgi:hypothetical protein
MAQLVLGNLGTALGARLLPQGFGILGQQVAGQAIGQTIGMIAGAAIDGRFLSPAASPRIREFHITESREGASIPVVYGRMRVGGQVIWAARFKEHRETSGGKGGPPGVDYSYSLSFAVALCAGEITQVTRCWANGEPFDLSKVNWRLYRGTEDQAPDALIAATEPVAPAYRGVAYVVFEDLPVDAFGARMPQLSFEVTRPVLSSPDRMEAVARVVNLIPGSGEFALATDVVRRRLAPGRETFENQHAASGVADLTVALEQLKAELPNVTRVNLVVGWFGDDLRCGECVIRPGVEVATKLTTPLEWRVAGVDREHAYVVSATGERPNYGGTPSDETVLQAIAALKQHGYHVTLYPFLFMDIPAGNGLADPHGAAEQAAFPWRGRVTCHPAPGVSGSVDGSSTATSQVATFFTRTGGYRDFILHCAELASEGEADGFLIGSELIGLTRVRDAAGGYPAVEALCELAADVRAILPAAEISYGADWTEYGAHVRNDGADVGFPLDALWAHEAISYVGLDWYAPMGDWRDAAEHADDGFADPYVRAYLDANIAGGEGYDWYYADDAGRSAQERLAITDGAFDEPWVFRQKDLVGWWSHAHHPRVSGERSETATVWAPGMKAVRFVEFGVPAVDKGANQPNVFFDPKSSESALPHFSDGSRDDLIQRRAVEAFHAHWADEDNNPGSEAVAQMIPEDGIGMWCWDARPYPQFPLMDDIWSDCGNWSLGHWLNGRTGLALLPDIVADVCGLAGVEVDVARLGGLVPGYRFDGPLSVRQAIEPLALAYGIDAVERGEVSFQFRGGAAAGIDEGRLVEDENGRSLEVTRAGMEQGAVSVRLRFIDAEADHAPGVVLSEGAVAAEAVDLEAAVAMDRRQAQRRANALADELTKQREQARFAMAADGVVLEAGDVVTLAGGCYRITEVADGRVISFSACAVGPRRVVDVAGVTPGAPPMPVEIEPDVVIGEAPPLPGEEVDLRPLAFAFSDPWVGAVTVSAGADASQLTVRGRIERPCTIGRLESALYPHVSGRWQETSVWVEVAGGAPVSRTDAAVLNGANVALVETEAGWEMIQFAEAELVGEGIYRLSRLLRGQQGSEAAMAAGAAVGSRIVFLTGAEKRMEFADWECGLRLLWRGWRSRPDEAAAWSGDVTVEGTAARMWSPAHLRSTWDGDDLRLGWVRRARKGGDSWGAGEPPHELPEAYRVNVLADGVSLRSWDVTGPAAVYDAGAMLADLPAGGEAVIEVGQLGFDGEPGWLSRVSVTVPAS